MNWKYDKEYSKLRKEYLQKNPMCKARIPGVCSNARGYNLTIHHKRGRGEYLLDTTTWLPCCLFCHEWIENNVQAAKDMGLSENRL